MSGVDDGSGTSTFEELMSSLRGTSSQPINYVSPLAPAGLRIKFANSGRSAASTCAACGKAGDDLKKCIACKTAMYCNRQCQVSHRRAHKKECKRIASRLVVEKKFLSREVTDEELFEQPPAQDECPICLIRLPVEPNESAHQSCCGQILCGGCIVAHVSANEKEEQRCCPFCRKRRPVTKEEDVEWMKERIKGGDATACYALGSLYYQHHDGYSHIIPKDLDKAIEYMFQAAEMGSVSAHTNIGVARWYGRGGLEQDEVKAIQHYQIAAMGGDQNARTNLGTFELDQGNTKRALKHWMISARVGHDRALKNIRDGFMEGSATKGEYELALRAHKKAKDETKSRQRDIAALAARIGVQRAVAEFGENCSTDSSRKPNHEDRRHR